MQDIDGLLEEELEEDLERVEIEAEEVGLEDLIVLGEDKKIPIHIIYPNEDGTKSRARALVKQLTLKELDGLNYNGNNLASLNMKVLQKALFKTNGEKFTKEELQKLPLGVVNAVSNKIFELSGVDTPTENRLKDF